MFLSVKEAAELTGKSATTIYRLCNKRINTEYVRKEDNKFLISREFLLAKYPTEEAEEPEEIINSTEEGPEMRFENVIDANSKTSADEKPVSLEKTETTENNESNKNAEDELESGSVIEFEEKAEKPYYQQFLTKEVLIGLAASLGAISIFIYLLFKLSN
jgi:hypothetical protein